jgi:hypothetical protein
VCRMGPQHLTKRTRRPAACASELGHEETFQPLPGTLANHVALRLRADETWAAGLGLKVAFEAGGHALDGRTGAHK